MKSYTQKNWKVILGLLLIVGLFGWFQARPAYIKHGCSWTKYHEDAIPADPGVTHEQAAEKEKQYEECIKNGDSGPGIKDPFAGIFAGTKDHFACHTDGYISPFGSESEQKAERLLNFFHAPQPAQPAKDWYQAATKQEYEFCLHNHGL